MRHRLHLQAAPLACTPALTWETLNPNTMPAASFTSNPSAAPLAPDRRKGMFLWYWGMPREGDTITPHQTAWRRSIATIAGNIPYIGRDERCALFSFCGAGVWGGKKVDPHVWWPHLVQLSQH